jgi:hypothetical protein
MPASLYGKPALNGSPYNPEADPPGKGLPPPVVIVIAITVLAITTVLAVVAAVPAKFFFLAPPGTLAGLDPSLHVVAQRLIPVTGETGSALRIQPYIPT